MKKLNYIKTILLGLAATASLSSCLKDKTYVDFSQGGVSAELPLSGLNSFSADAITTDTAIISFGVNIASSKTLTTDTKITVDVIPTKIAEYVKNNPAVQYEIMPATAYTFKTTIVDIPAGQRLKILTFTVYKNKLDPSKSFMLPIGITSAPGLNISANNALHYYHVIGNDFAGIYVYDYRRWQDGANGPGDVTVGGVTRHAIPSKGEGLAPDGPGIFTGHQAVISPISPTEFAMTTTYNGQGVQYDVTFTRTVATDGTINYTNWKVIFNADNIKKWTDVNITNFRPAEFTIPPPATSKDPKIFELNYSTGAAAPGRWMDDTYHK
ncbi:DUF1735 domain-containing protein [Mucilaginibacter angelicae]|uniref:DUF1735 domain-containing protein n=1 Tax=Mucilaginibacter angelicae TaxID=869718 RepID=A0ABV6LCQ1_9SPHI